MTKKVEIYDFGTNGIPEGLARKLIIPEHINSNGHPLRHYVNPDLLTSELDIALLEDFEWFYQDLTENIFGRCRGLYIDLDHVWVNKETYKKINEAVKEEYGVDFSRALILPLKRVDYRAFIHEALHDVFNHLTNRQREMIVHSAAFTYVTSADLTGMLQMTHLGTYDFQWAFDENNCERNYSFSNLKFVEQLRVVDEFIANFFSSNRLADRWSEKHLKPEFGETLQTIGYNLINPPEVNY